MSVKLFLELLLMLLVLGSHDVQNEISYDLRKMAFPHLCIDFYFLFLLDRVLPIVRFPLYLMWYPPEPFVRFSIHASD